MDEGQALFLKQPPEVFHEKNTKIFQNLPGNTCAKDRLIKNETSTQVLFCIFSKFLRASFFLNTGR